MQTSKIKQVVIVGGGTAGWMSAASLANHFTNNEIHITLVESSSIGTIGVGEATVPSIRDFNQSLGIDEQDLLSHVNGTYKLGIEFCNWKDQHTSFFHPFNDYGLPLNNIDFHHYITRLRLNGTKLSMSDYCLSTAMAKANKFAQPSATPPTPIASFNYALHFDASLYASYLAKYAKQRGVKRIDANICGAELNEKSGHIDTLLLEDGRKITGDLFIDCSGFSGLLIEKQLKTGYEDWSNWLPVNRAVVAQTSSHAEIYPYTRSSAQKAGWQWRIPLQTRTGNGYVFSSKFIDDENAEKEFRESLDAPLETNPRFLSFQSGMRKKLWNKNCIAIGLSAGFVEPLESTAISLIQSAISYLLQFFPYNGFNTNEIKEVNRQYRNEIERIRDFLILHYKLSGRRDSDFWRHVTSMDIPNSLQQKIALYKSRGYLISYEQESFKDASWLSMYEGFEYRPEAYDTRCKNAPEKDIKSTLKQIEHGINESIKQLLSHEQFIHKHCPYKE